MVNMLKMYQTPCTEQSVITPAINLLGTSSGDISISSTAADPAEKVY